MPATGTEDGCNDPRPHKETARTLRLIANLLEVRGDSPHRIRALALGVQLIINPDAQSVEGLDAARWGSALARKAGARAHDVVNAQDIGGFLRRS